MKRYKTAWYSKRILQNSKIQKFLIKMINKHKEPTFPWSNQELRFLKNEDLAEIAIAAVNKTLDIVLGESRDHSDGSDTKCIINAARNNIKQSPRTGKSHWTNSYFVPGVKGKKGAIRVVAYNTHLDKFEFFYIPHKEIAGISTLEIPIETYRTESSNHVPTFTGRVPEGQRSKWYKHECMSFEEMALSSH
jgi:hypothetical protein